MAMESLEREIKLGVDLRFQMPDLTAAATGLKVVPRPVLRLAATYYDTPDLQLLRRGITLRRREDRLAGSENLWTLKLPAGTPHAHLARNEHSWSGELPEIPEEARFLVHGLVRHSDIVIVAKLLTTRRRAEVVDGDGERLAEVDDDVVSVMSGVRQGLRFREIEIELGETGDDIARSLVTLLCEAGATLGDKLPKLDRAMSLGRRRTFDVDEVGPDSSVEDLLRFEIATGVDRLLDHDPGLRVGGSDIEYVHQARVATRRLRSDLRTFAKLLDPTWTTRIRDDLKWLGAVLGAVRDADVLDENLTLQAAGSAPNDAPAFAALHAELHRQRQRARSDLLGAIETERYFDLLDDLAAAVANPPVRAPAPDRAGPLGEQDEEDGDREEEGRDGPHRPGIEPAAPAALVLHDLLRRPWRQLRQAVRTAGAHPTDEQLHRIRIRSKQLRYAAEAAVPVMGTPARRLGERASELQTVLGDLHDALAAEAWLRDAATAGTPSQAFAAGQLVVREQQRQVELRHNWHRSWKALAKQARRTHL